MCKKINSIIHNLKRLIILTLCVYVCARTRVFIHVYLYVYIHTYITSKSH